MQTLDVELVKQILLLMPYTDCLQLAKTSKHFYSIFTGCYYHSAKIEDIDHWLKFLMTGYIPQALRLSSFTRNEKVEVKAGVLIRLDLSENQLTSVPHSIVNLINLTRLYFDIIKGFAEQSVNIYSGFFRKSDQFDWIVL
jgi:hypothetical protein